MNSAKTRSTLIGVVGGYLGYLAWQLFDERGNTDTAMTPAARIIFIVLFAAAGIGLIVYAWKLWKRALREEKEHSDDSDKSMK